MRERKTLEAEGKHRSHRLRRRGDVKIVRVAVGRVHGLPIDRPAERHQVGFGDGGRRFRQKAVDHGEDDRVAADHERDQRDRGDAHTRRSRQDANAGAKIGEQLLDGRPRPHAARVLGDQRDVAELENRLPCAPRPGTSLDRCCPRVSRSRWSLMSSSRPSSARLRITSVTPVRRGAESGLRLWPACPICRFRPGAACGPWARGHKTWRVGCFRRHPRRT